MSERHRAGCISTPKCMLGIQHLYREAMVQISSLYQNGNHCIFICYTNNELCLPTIV